MSAECISATRRQTLGEPLLERLAHDNLRIPIGIRLCVVKKVDAVLQGLGHAQVRLVLVGGEA